MAMALDDVTVLDLSHALAGPFASTLLGDFGAHVIKVEPPGVGGRGVRCGVSSLTPRRPG